MLPRRIPKAPKRASRWRSQAHANFVREHACCGCGDTECIEFAHLRKGSGAGLGQKPDDWLAISLCNGCHAEQHRIGEAQFDRRYRIDSQALAREFAKASPKAAEIARVQRERGNG